MNLRDIVDERAVVVGFNAKTKEDVIKHLAEILYQNGAIDNIQHFVDDVYLREAEGQTGIGGGIAIPHGKSECVKQSCVAICRTRHPVEWESIDDEPVSLIFLFAVQHNEDDVHLKMMATIAKALAHEDICNDLCNVSSRQEVFSIMDRMSSFAK